MAFDADLAGRIRDHLVSRQNIEDKKMFGGVGFLLNGNMLVGVWKNTLIARIGPDAYAEALLEPYVHEFDITGKPMKGWVMIEPPGITDDEQLAIWIERAMTFVKSLPGK